MRKNIRLFVIAVSLIVCCVTAVAIGNFNGFHKKNVELDARSELRRLYNRLMSDESLNISGTIYLSDGKTPGKIKEETPFQFTKVKQDYYYQLGFLRTFSCRNLWMQIDTLNHYVAISSLEKLNYSNQTNAALPFEQMLSDTSFLKTDVSLSEEGSLRVLEIESGHNPSVKTCRIYYEPESYQIKKSEIEWWKEPFVESGNAESSVWLSRIEYQYHHNTPRISEEMEKFVEIKGNQVKTKPGYSEYQLTVL